MLILAGVTIHFTLGENGILRNAETAGEKYEEANAKEQITLELSNIQTKKYKETGKKATLEDVKNLINKDKYDVTIEEGGSSATIEDLEKEYTFIVEENLTIQDVEKITNLDKTIKIETSATNKSDYTTSTLKAKITLTEEIASMKIGQVEIEIPAKTEENGKNVYEIEKQVEKNGNYKIKIETVNGNTNYKIQKVSEISEDMEIRTPEELAWFRDRVNNGATYKERTITLMNDLDLRSVCSKEKTWESIGKYNPKIEGKYNKFSGTFNGNNKTIDYLYIETTEELSQGLFGYTLDATVNGVIIGQNSSINAVKKVGGIVGYAQNTIIQNCGNNANVTGQKDCVGGIVGMLDNGNIIACYNKADITSKENGANVGGICGNSTISLYNENEKNIIQYAYNTGTITGKDGVGGIIGNQNGYTQLEKSFNKGNVKAINNGSSCGGITGSISAFKYINEEIIETKEAESSISYTCNIKNINSDGDYVGGICGQQRKYCTIKNNYILNKTKINNTEIDLIEDIGKNDTYIGKYIGKAHANNEMYIDANGKITNTIDNENDNITNTVYYIVNGMSNGESKYWSKNNLIEPKLKWELK